MFFAVGVRLFLAGLRQTLTPAFTLQKIFEIDSPEANHIVQELGFANLSMGSLGLLALLDPMLTLAGAVTGGLSIALPASNASPQANATPCAQRQWSPTFWCSQCSQPSWS